MFALLLFLDCLAEKVMICKELYLNLTPIRVAHRLSMSTTFFWKSVRPYRDRGRWSLPQDAFAFGILYCNEISDSNWRWTDSIRFMLLYFQQPNFLYPAKSLLNFIENERFDVNHVIIFISHVNTVFWKKEKAITTS